MACKPVLRELVPIQRVTSVGDDGEIEFRD